MSGTFLVEEFKVMYQLPGTFKNWPTSCKKSGIAFLKMTSDVLLVVWEDDVLRVLLLMEVQRDTDSKTNFVKSGARPYDISWWSEGHMIYRERNLCGLNFSFGSIVWIPN